MPPYDSLQAAVTASVASREAIQKAAQDMKDEYAKPRPLPVTPADFKPAA